MAWSSPRTWVTNEVVTAAHMNQEVRDNLDAALPDEVSAVAWTPNIEGTTFGSVAAQSGRRWRVGPLEFVWARFTGMGGAGGAFGGVFFVTLPSTVSGLTASTSAGRGQTVGSWQSRDVSNASASEGGSVLLRSSTEVHFARPVGGLVTDSSPFAWVTDDILSFQAHYPIA